MNFSEDFSKYPMCDCDLWLKLCWGNVIDKLFEIHEKVIIADFVEEEILRWKKNKKYNKPVHDLKYYKDSNRVIVISHDDFEEDRIIIERQFQDFGHYLGFTDDPVERKNKGEYASAIYADYLGITLLKSDDKKFKQEAEIHFDELTIKNLNETLRDFRFNKHKDRIKVVQKIERISKAINDEREKNQRKLDIDEVAASKDIEQNSKTHSKNSMQLDDMIAQLANKFNS